MPTDEPSWPDDVGLDPVERQIREAMARGEFDSLPGAGKPLPDLDTHYEPSWWAKRWVERSRREDTVNELRSIVRREAPRLKAATDREGALRRARELNAAIEAANASLPDEDRIPLIDV